MTERVLPPEEHIAQVTNWRYGLTGNIRIDCACGAYWTVPHMSTTDTITESIKNHLGTIKRPPTKPD